MLNLSGKRRSDSAEVYFPADAPQGHPPQQVFCCVLSTYTLQ